MQKNIAVFLMTSLISGISFAEMYFFEKGEDIDFWNEGKSIPEVSIKAFRNRAFNKSHGESNDSFWNRMNNPNRLEFWDDGGGYYAPEAYRRAAINPTNENIKRYLEWEENRTQMVGTFVEKLQAYAQRDIESRQRESTSDLPLEEVTITYIYSGDCPSCQKHIPVIENLRKMGVRFLFVNRYPNSPELYPDSVPWENGFEKRFPINGTPTSFVGYGQNTARISGAREASDYISTIRHLIGGNK